MNRVGSEKSNSSHDPRFISRAKSCTRCRQAKVACDARKTLNGPCSRCRLKDFDCHFDANFKRVSTRRLTEEISYELHALHSAKETCHSKSSNLESAQYLKIIPENDTTSSSAESALFRTDLSEDALSWLNTTSNDLACSYNLGNLKLEAHIVIEFFQYFAIHYQPHAMFLQSVSSVSDLLDRSPLLFWTVILVASQEHDRFAAVYNEVATEYERLLSPILRKAIQRIETIHALLLLCLWPVPQSQYFHNPAWNYTGLAVHAAIQLHCHSPLDSSREPNVWPGFALVAEGEVSRVDQARTWLGCFRVGTAVANLSGLPPPISTQKQMRSINEALRTTSNLIPSWWNALFSILKITISITEALDSVEVHALQFSVTQLFSEQLDEIKRVNLDSWRSELEIEWCNAKLHLFALTFTTPINTDLSQNTQIQIHRQMILLKAFDVAANLITQFMKIGQLGASELHPGGLLKFVPELYFTSLFNATAFLFRFMATFMGLTPAQRSQAMGYIIEAHKIFQSYPHHREFTRAAIHIESLIDILKKGAPVGMSELVVKNKLGASIMLDAIFHACRQRNIDPRTGRPLAVQEWRTVNETFAQRLPELPAQKLEHDVRGSYVGKNGLESDQRAEASAEQNSQWWEEWDNYIDLFRIDEQQFDMGLEPSLDENDNLGGFGGSTST